MNSKEVNKTKYQNAIQLTLQKQGIYINELVINGKSYLILCYALSLKLFAHIHVGTCIISITSSEEKHLHAHGYLNETKESHST